MTCTQLGLCPKSLYWTFIYVWHICSPCSCLSYKLATYKHCHQDVKLLYTAENATGLYNTTTTQQLTKSWFNLSLANGEATELRALFCVCSNVWVHLCGRCPRTQALEHRPWNTGPRTQALEHRPWNTGYGTQAVEHRP